MPETTRRGLLAGAGDDVPAEERARRERTRETAGGIVAYATERSHRLAVFVLVCVGWVFFREHFGLQELIAMLIIFAGVALVKRYSLPPSPKPAQVSAAS